jgi:hypothetical protein
MAEAAVANASGVGRVAGQVRPRGPVGGTMGRPDIDLLNQLPPRFLVSISGFRIGEVETLRAACFFRMS